MKKKLFVLFFVLVTPSLLFASDSFSNSEICKACISSVMGRSSTIIQIDKVSGSVVYLSYKRPDDQKKWSYKCKVEEHNIVWASKTGRWRNHPADSKIKYEIEGTGLNIIEIFSDGSFDKNTFTRDQLKQR